MLTISLLTALVIGETFIIALVFVAFLLRKNHKLKASIRELMTVISEKLFSRLVDEEIERTNEQIDSLANSEFDLAANENEENNKHLIQLLTFRSSYLHAELNAYESSNGDPELFWFYLSENLEPLAQRTTGEKAEPAPPAANEFIDEVMQDLYDKLDKATDSNVKLQALLDSLISDGSLSTDQLQVIKKSQIDFHDLSNHVADLENKINNSLHLNITGSSGDTAPVYIEKNNHKINTETNRLKDIIFDQGNQINQLINDLKKQAGPSLDQNIASQLTALEKMHKETAVCLEVMEMENDRLFNQVELLQQQAGSEETEQLKATIRQLEKIITEKEQAYQQLSDEFKSVEKEFLAVYNKQNK